MLTRLNIKNVALVETVDLRFGEGLTVLTGETGAGKSVLVGALALVLGSRADRETVRHGAEEAAVEAVFDLSRLSQSERESLDPYGDDDLMLLNRTVSAGGQSRATINGKRAGLDTVAALTSSLAEIIGQHASQRLMNEQNHLEILDEYGGLTEPRQQVSELFRQWRATDEELRRTMEHRDLMVRERELLLFQREEIEKANVRAGEEEALQAERRRLDSARALMQSANLAGEILDGEGQSALELLRQVRHELESMAAVDQGLEGQVSELLDLQLRLEDLRRAIEQYGASIVDDPERLDQINLRLDELYRLKKKYGGSEEAVLKSLDEIRCQLETHPETGELIAELQARSENLRAQYSDNAIALSKARRRAATKLEKTVVAELRALAIDQASFRFAFEYENDPDGVILEGKAVRPLETGLEQVRLMFSANPGEPLRSLVKTASGGEISRVLLAIKSAILARGRARMPLLIFDEVDAGIGGQTASEVAAKLKALAGSGQVVVVTHLHQIARLADHHFAVQKVAGPSGRSRIAVRRLAPDEIAAELERMVGLPSAV